MRRKFAALLLSAAMVCSILAGCSSSGPASSTPSTSKPSNDTSTTTPPGGNNSNNNNGNSTTEPDNSNSDSTSNSSTVQKLRIDNFGYSVIKGTSSQSSHVHTFFSITNPNKDYDVKSVHIRYYVKDENGAVIGTAWYDLPLLAPGDSTLFGAEIFVDSGTVKSVSYTVIYDSCVATKHSDTNFPKYSDLKASNISYVPNSGNFDWPRIKGTLFNASSSDVTGVCIQVFYKKNGKIVAYDCGYLKDDNYNFITLHPGESAPFDVIASTFYDFDYDSFEVVPVICDFSS